MNPREILSYVFIKNFQSSTIHSIKKRNEMDVHQRRKDDYILLWSFIENENE